MNKLNQMIRNDKVMIPIAVIGGLTLASFSVYVNPQAGFIEPFWWLIIAASFCTVVLTVLHAYRESMRIRVGAHTDIYTLRIAYFMLMALLVYQELSLEMVLLAIHQGLLFGVLFDPLRNKYGNQPFFYTGSEAWHDRISINYPRIFFGLEIVLLFLTTLYFLVYESN